MTIRSSCNWLYGMQEIADRIYYRTMYSPNYPDDSTKIVGRAFTVKYIPRSEEAAVNLEGHYVRPWPFSARILPTLTTIPSVQIDQVAPGSVVFISAPQGTVNALYGGLMSCRAQYLGAAGTVVDGRIRDLREHRQLAYPVGPSLANPCFCQLTLRPARYLPEV